MNIEEAKKEIEKYYVTSVSTEDVKLIRTEVAYRVIDNIYDDFEKRTCESCKYNTFNGVNSLGLAEDCSIGYKCARAMKDMWETKDDN